MSGGHFDYPQNKLQYFTESLALALLEQDDESSENWGKIMYTESMETIYKALKCTRATTEIARAIDYYFSGDIGEEECCEIINEEINKIKAL